MMSQTLLQALQEQYNIERYNQTVYEMLASALDVAYWPGSSGWMRQQASEEIEHARKLADYLVDRGYAPTFTSIENMQMIDALDLTPAFEAAANLEAANTERIKMLYHLSEEEADPQTCQFLMWYLAEQTEADGILNNYLTALRRLDMNGKMVFDHEEFE